MGREKKSVVVTGASRGLGRALAEELAARGDEVVLVARSSAPLEDVVAGIRARGGRAHAIAADVGDKHAIHRIAATAQALAGPIEVVVHNASTLGPSPLALLLDTECEDFEHALAVNVVGPMRLTKALAGPMILRSRGTIVHISSDAAVNAYPTWGAYGASKAALDHLSRTLAEELGEAGIRAFSVDPGEMDTAMHREAMPDADPASLRDPRDVARAIATLVDDPTRAPNGARVVLGDQSIEKGS